ncbi:hypothetical protein dqs_2448 [Azoarcus olearius]|nr:hypothetical protein dqs_2448 [Azoarcus olearius]
MTGVNHGHTVSPGAGARLAPLCGAAAVLGFAGLVVLRGPASPGTVGALLACAGFGLALASGRLHRDEAMLALIFALVPLYCVLNLALTGWDPGQLDKPGRLLLAIGIMLALSRCGLPAHWLHHGCLVGCYAAAAMAAWQVEWLGMERASGPMNAIPFGNNALLLGFFAAAGWLAQPAQQRGTPLTLVTAGATLAALYASFASGSRGGWIAIPALAWILALAAERTRRGHRLAYAATALALTVATVAAVPALHARSVAEIDAVLHAWHATPAEAARMELSSVGTRLQLYRLGLDAFLAHPLSGIGYGQLAPWLAAQAQAGLLPPDFARYTHLHSGLIDTAARGGVLGLLALGGLLGGLGRYFAPGLRHADAEARAFALYGLLATVAALLFSLTNVFFPAIVGTNILVLTLAVPAGALAHRLRVATGGAR